MKHNRIWLAVMLSVVSAALCGCTGMGSLSEENSDLVAEYSAGVLLRFSDEYRYKLITSEQLVKEKQQSETPEQETAVSPPPTAQAPSAAGNDTAEVSEQQSTSLNDIYQQKGLDFSFKSGRFCDKYQENKNVSPIKPGKGETLFVAAFQVKNTSGKKKNVDLRKSGVTYKLILDGSEFRPSINILSNGGLNFLNTSIGGGQKEEAVLIFNVSAERKNSSAIQLAVEKGGKTSTIKIK